MKIRGFTLLECLITLSMIGLLSLFSIHSYSNYLQKNTRQTLIDELGTAIQFAKIQSLILGKTVYLNPLEENWSNGMRLQQFNKNKQQMELIHQWQWHHRGWHLSWAGFNSHDVIVISNIPSKSISNGRFRLINTYTNDLTTLTLNKLGRIKIS